MDSSEYSEQHEITFAELESTPKRVSDECA